MLCLDALLQVERKQLRPRGLAELLRVIELDPARQWDRIQPTGRAARLAQYLGQHTGIQVTEETVRIYLHAHDYGGLRPTWTDAGAKPSIKPMTR